MVKTMAALILDKSGSMYKIANAARKNFNEQLQVLKRESKDPDVQTKISVFTFNDTVKVIDFDVDADKISEITEEEYNPDGMTALFDAIGLAISKFEDTYTLDDETGVLFTIITDGLENRSQEYAGEEGREKLKKKIEDLKNTGKWTFTFMGTDLALDQAKDLGIDNTMQFVASVQGIKDAHDRHNLATSSYYSTRKTSKKTMVDNFYDSK